jgi:NADH:ubiquinone oxidoreductase subunit 4 (subunit M)
MFPLLTFIVFAPLVTGVIVLIAPDRAAKWIAAVVTGVLFIASLWLYFGPLTSG